MISLPPMPLKYAYDSACQEVALVLHRQIQMWLSNIQVLTLTGITFHFAEDRTGLQYVAKMQVSLKYSEILSQHNFTPNRKLQPIAPWKEWDEGCVCWEFKVWITFHQCMCDALARQICTWLDCFMLLRLGMVEVCTLCGFLYWRESFEKGCQLDETLVYPGIPNLLQCSSTCYMMSVIMYTVNCWT